MKIEAFIEKEVLKAAKSAGWFHRKVKWRDSRDAPDDVLIKDGRTVWIEFKSPAEPARKAQLDEHAEMRKHGAEVYVVDMIAPGLRVLGIDA